MKTTKKPAALLLALAMVLACLTACGEATNAEAPDGKEQTAAEETVTGETAAETSAEESYDGVLVSEGEMKLDYAENISIELYKGGYRMIRGGSNDMSMLVVPEGMRVPAITDFFVTFAKEQDIVNLTSWSMGSFSGANWSNVRFSALMCLLGFLAAWLLSKPIAAYALGEGYAKSLGINIKLFRGMLIVLSSFLSACVTAFAGPVSFVGIAVPHITRTLLKTSRPLLVIPATYLCGAVFCIFCDLIARTAFSPTEMAIGTVTSAFGAPVVIGMMLKRHRPQEE